MAAEVGAADDPHAVVARGDADHAGRESALESGANDRPVPATDDVEIAAAHLQVGRGDVEEVVRPRVDKLKLPKAILDWRGVQHLWLLAQIEPRQRIGGVLIRRIDSVLIRARDVTNAAELVHRTMARDVVADRDARARAEDALGIEQRHSRTTGLGAEPQTEVVVADAGLADAAGAMAISAAKPKATPAARRRSRRVSLFMSADSSGAF